ncbi:MAG: pilus assembly protein N-terminal domain-containing protein [Allosphingosinicella sp.]
MHKTSLLSRATVGTAAAAMITASLAAVAPVPAFGAPGPAAVRPGNDVTLSVGTGRMVHLDAPMSDLFVANDAVADVQVRSANQVYIFGKAPGETTVFATDKAGRTIYSANVRVGTNIASVDEMLHIAMPEAQVRVTPMNGIVLLTGTVASPTDVEEVTRLVQNYVGTGTQVLSRLKTATPLQVMLQVKVAEVSRTLVRQIGVNLLARDTSSGFLFGAGQGNPGSISTVTSDSDPSGVPKGGTLFNFTRPALGTTLGAAGHLLGMDLLSTLNLAENDGRVHTLAEPNLTALSGETASFLAGGEFPIPIANGISGTAIEYKQYGVSLAFTPTVLEGGRISMRVRPEVSELSDEGAIKINGFQIPSLTTRRTETTVELGSGQSFMIAGLLRNHSGASVDKAPVLGSLPIIGALFKSSNFKRNETELVIIVTPYLVRPVNASQIALPTDGFRGASTMERVFLDKNETNVGTPRPIPHMAPPQAAPGVGAMTAVPQPGEPAPQRDARQQPQPAVRPQQQASAAPGFSL